MGTHPKFKLHGASTGVYVCISIYIFFFFLHNVYIRLEGWEVPFGLAEYTGRQSEAVKSQNDPAL